MFYNRITTFIKGFIKADTATRHPDDLPEPLAYEVVEPASYAVKRAAAKEFLGNKWILHPENMVQRQQPEPGVLARSKDNA